MNGGFVAPSIVASTIVGALEKQQINKEAPTSVKTRLKVPRISRAKRGVIMRGGVFVGRFYFSPHSRELGQFVFRERPHLRVEFRGATDKVEAACNVRADFDHRDTESTEMKVRNKNEKHKKLCDLCASVVKKLLKTAKTWQSLAELVKKWQNVAEWFILGQV